MEGIGEQDETVILAQHLIKPGRFQAFGESGDMIIRALLESPNIMIFPVCEAFFAYLCLHLHIQKMFPIKPKGV